MIVRICSFYRIKIYRNWYHKGVVVVGADKMSSINYEDRATCIILEMEEEQLC